MRNNFPERIVITGAGATSPLGDNLETISHNLEQGISGIGHSEMLEGDKFSAGAVAGNTPLPEMPDVDLPGRNLKRDWKKLGQESKHGLVAALDALQSANMEAMKDPELGLLVGSGGSDTDMLRAVSAYLDGSAKRLSPLAVQNSMSDTLRAYLTTLLGIRNAFPGISSACATGLHAIGEAAQQITHQRIDRVLAGAGEGHYPATTIGFDKARALAKKQNDKIRVEPNSRPYDIDRNGFVISSGAGMVVVESLTSAIARDAEECILAEIVGYGNNSDGGTSMTDPNPEQCAEAIKEAMRHIDPAEITSVNPHGTSTPNGDISELNALALAFGGADKVPPIGATKSLTGHSLGATGAQEIIYSILALNGNFVPPTRNIQNLDPAAAEFNIIQVPTSIEQNMILTENFGFGGTNGAMVLKKWTGQ